MKSSTWVKGLLLLVLVSGCAFQHRLLVNPEVSIPPGRSMSQVEKATREAFMSYGWTIDGEEPGVTRAHLDHAGLFASVRVDYDQKLAKVRYVDSKKFMYQKSASGEERIHGHYLTWVNNIADKLRESLIGPDH